MKTIAKQTKTFGPVKMADGSKITATVRFDDSCGNGHNTFTITGETKDSSGCIHGEISKYFPELAPFLKYHLMSADGPLHYMANTMYLASSRDCYGLEQDEKQQITNCRTGVRIWKAVCYDQNGNQVRIAGIPYRDSLDKPEDDGDIKWVPVYRIGKGKPVELEAARQCAIWPDASLEDLQDESKLKARLPALIKELKLAVETLGLVWE